VADLRHDDLRIVSGEQRNRIENFSDAEEAEEKSQQLCSPE
jgi:hypothetical protein